MIGYFYIWDTCSWVVPASFPDLHNLQSACSETLDLEVLSCNFCPSVGEHNIHKVASTLCMVQDSLSLTIFWFCSLASSTVTLVCVSITVRLDSDQWHALCVGKAGHECYTSSRSM